MNTTLDALGLAYLFAAAMYASQAAYTFLFGVRDRSTPERLHFALLCAGLSISACGGLGCVLAADFEAVRTATRIVHTGNLLGMASFVAFACSFTSLSRHVEQAAYGLSLVGFVTIALNVHVADSFGGAAMYELWPGARPVVPSTSVGSALAVVATVIVTVTIWSFRRAELSGKGSSGEERWLILSALPALVATFHDVLMMLGVVESQLIGPLGALPMVGVVALMFMGRVVSTAERLSQRTADLRTTHFELRNTQRRLVRREQLAAVGELSAVIAHEVRNPLAVIKNAVAGLRRPKLRDEDRATLLEILGEETGRLNRLMHDLLAYARPVTPRLRALDVRSLLRRVVGRIDAGKNRIEIDVPAGMTIQGDAELLRHAFVNIVENAVQAMDGGLLRIEASRVRGGGRVSFADEGEGMDGDTMQKAASPFFTTKPSGTGLGLAIVDRILKSHEGELRVSSMRGEGTTVECTLLDRPISEGDSLT